MLHNTSVILREARNQFKCKFYERILIRIHLNLIIHTIEIN